MSDRRKLLGRAAPLALLLVLAGTVLIPTAGDLVLEDADRSAARGLTGALDALPDDAFVLIAFDPDLGTYAEVRPTVRTLVADLLERGARLGFISLTPEGRGLALEELQRMRESGVAADSLLDLGYLPGAEAALVSVANAIAAPERDSALGPRGLAGRPRLAIVIGGNDIGPRSWVEQVEPRVPDLPIAAIVPTTLLPDAQPYVESGQLAALIATPRDGATYRAAADVGAFEAVAETDGPSAPAILAGLLAALAVLGAGVVARLGELARAGRASEPA